MNKTTIPFLVSILGIVAIILTYYVNGFGALGLEALAYCEAPRTGWVKQPANSWSNLAFILAGWAIAWDQMNRSGRSQHIHYTILATFAVLIGLGSFVFHATTTVIGLHFDAISMYLLSTFLTAISISRLTRNNSVFIPSWMTAMAISLYFHFNDYSVGSIDSGSTAFGVFLLLALVLELIVVRQQGRKMEFKWVALFVGSFALSLFIWNRSRTGGAWCDPNSLIQGHAMWHILDAACLYFLYRYYVSEKELSANT